MDNRIKELDGLRGIAIILVLALHLFKRAAYFTDHAILETITNLTSAGWMGVDIFFTLSGFLITSILLRAKSEEHYFRNFYVRRVLRIFPLYYAGVAFILLFVPGIEPEFTQQLRTALPLMLVYQQNWAFLFDGLNITDFLAVTWSLAIEEQFYFLWPFIVYKLNKEHLFKASVRYIVVSIAVRISAALFWPNEVQASGFFYYNSFTRFEEMLFGGLLAIFLTYEGAQERVRRFSFPLFAASSILFIVLCISTFFNSPNLGYNSVPLMIGRYTIIPLFTIGLIGVFVTYPPKNVLRRLFRNPILAFFGKYSYSMYLFHMTPALILLDVLWHSGLRGWKPYVLYIGTTFAATVLIALLTWNLLEKHMLGLKKYFEYKNPS